MEARVGDGVGVAGLEGAAGASHEVRPARCMSGGAVRGQTALRFASSCFLLIIQRSGLPPCGSP